VFWERVCIALFWAGWGLVWAVWRMSSLGSNQIRLVNFTNSSLLRIGVRVILFNDSE
jgi:hypothetical protein